jgi:ketosteroid isomerase-like protein
MRICMLFILSTVAWSADPKELIQMEAAFDKATLERGLDGFMSFFAEDGVVLMPNVGPVKGKAAIRKTKKAGFSRPGFSLRWKPEYADIAASGDLGYTYGPYTLTFTGADGKKVTRTGRYFTVWKKQPDGNWRVVLDNGIQDDPPPQN